MDIMSELKIEHRRLGRHVQSLKSGFDDAVVRDLSACLRNWVQMAQEIDALAERQGWRLAFRRHRKPSAIERLRSRGTFVSIPLPGGAQADGVAISGLVVHNRALTEEEVKRSYELSRGAFSESTVMSLRAFLNAER